LLAARCRPTTKHYLRHTDKQGTTFENSRKHAKTRENTPENISRAPPTRPPARAPPARCWRSHTGRQGSTRHTPARQGSTRPPGLRQGHTRAARAPHARQGHTRAARAPHARPLLAEPHARPPGLRPPTRPPAPARARALQILCQTRAKQGRPLQRGRPYQSQTVAPLGVTGYVASRRRAAPSISRQPTRRSRPT